MADHRVSNHLVQPSSIFRGEASGDKIPLVAVVIPSYNYAQYVGQAIESVLAQTMQDFEIVVVDDGSTDNTVDVVAQYPQVKYVRQDNQGLSAARNTGIKQSSGRYLVFLDSDDLLLPTALEVGLKYLALHPQCAFVAGTYRIIRDEKPVYTSPQAKVPDSHYLAFLRGNIIGMHATVMYQRSIFDKVGMFDPTLRACEDYDMYLRISREHPVATHSELIADYRMHGNNMSGNLGLMVKYSTGVLSRQRQYLTDEASRAAYRQGLKGWREYYTTKLFVRLRHAANASKLLTKGHRLIGPFVLRAPVELSEQVTKRIKTMIRRIWNKLIPAPVRQRFRPAQARKPQFGQINLGDLRNLEPVSRHYGFDRGLPIDRHYLEEFLNLHRLDIQGRVLEIGGNDYTIRFGEARVKQSDVLHVEKGNPKATIIGDLSKEDNLPANAFDCVILTQTLHLIYDVQAAIANLHRILKPGGVLLLTVPGTISQIERGTWAKVWYWGFTELSVRRLFEERFDPNSINIQVHGNVLAAIAFLEGIAAQELHQQELQFHDPLYPLLITLRAQKKSSDPLPRVTDETVRRQTK